VHVAIAHAAKEHGLTHAVILDFDLHHGDGSQAIAWSLNELAASGSTAAKKTQGLHVPTIGYFSLHDINSYPCEYGERNKIQAASININGAHGQHIHNVHLRPYSSQAQFWDLYESCYRSLFHHARNFLTTASAKRGKKEFSAGIFLSAGFDASEHESPGMQRHDVNVPTDFFAQFTADAVALASELCGGRVLSVLEGGYSDRALTSGVFAHISGLSCSPPEEAAFVPPSISLSPYGALERRVAWDAAWWAPDRLEEIEKLLNKPAPVRERKQTSFMDPTAASTARFADVVPRRISSSFHSLSPSPAPPPPKPWQEVAVELSQCFIPVYEESKPIPAAEGGKRKPAARHSMPTAASPMTLRERKPKPAAAALNSSHPPSRAPSRAGTPALPKAPPVHVASTGATVAGPRQPIRRVSTTVLNPKKTQTATAPPPTRKVSAPMGHPAPTPPPQRKVSAPLPSTGTVTPSPPPHPGRKVSGPGTPVVRKASGAVSPKNTLGMEKMKARVGAGTPPSSPPVIEVNGVEVGNGLGRFHGVVGNPHHVVPGVFGGGEIRFAESNGV
jgi:histone deacetylase HOS3